MDASNFKTTARERLRISEYQKLKGEGVLVQLDIQGTSIFQSTTEWAEIGVPTKDTRARIMRPGRKLLFPKSVIDRLNSCVSRVRQECKACTHELTGFAPYRYLHYKQYDDFGAAWQRFQAELSEFHADIETNYDGYVDTMVAEYNAIAAEAWQAAQSAGAEFVFLGERSYDDLDSFTDALVSRVIAKIPSRDKIRESIKASYKSALIQGFDDIAREEARAQRLREEAEQAKIETLKLEQEAYHQQKLNQIEEDDRRRKLELMFSVEAAHIREQLTQTLAGPVEESFVALREYLADTATEMIQKIQAGTFVHGKTAAKAVETLSALYEARSIVDDQRMVERLKELQTAVGPIGDARPKDMAPRDPQTVVNALEAIRDLVSSAREDFMAEPSAFAALEVE